MARYLGPKCKLSRREGTDLSIITYAATVWKSLEAAEQRRLTDRVLSDAIAEQWVQAKLDIEHSTTPEARDRPPDATDLTDAALWHAARFGVVAIGESKTIGFDVEQGRGHRSSSPLTVQR